MFDDNYFYTGNTAVVPSPTKLLVMQNCYRAVVSNVHAVFERRLSDMLELVKNRFYFLRNEAV